MDTCPSFAKRFTGALGDELAPFSWGIFQKRPGPFPSAWLRKPVGLSVVRWWSRCCRAHVGDWKTLSPPGHHQRLKKSNPGGCPNSQLTTQLFYSLRQFELGFSVTYNQTYLNWCTVFKIQSIHRKSEVYRAWLTDQEMTVMEYIMRYPQLPTERDTPLQEDPHGEAPGLVRTREGWGWTMSRSPHCGSVTRSRWGTMSLSGSTGAYFGHRG